MVSLTSVLVAMATHFDIIPIRLCLLIKDLVYSKRFFFNYTIGLAVIIDVIKCQRREGLNYCKPPKARLKNLEGP